MIAPLSWLKEYVDINLKPKELGDRLTEVGLGCEKIVEKNGDIIFELEITPNRPDLLSIIGVAREIAAIESKKVKYPKAKTDINVKPKKVLPLKIETNSAINPRFTGIIIEGINVKESPTWLWKRLESIGQRPINNIVDITNYVMFELGNPLHVFDYDKIKGNIMRVHKTKGGEKFKSVDEISYHLPASAVVISDADDIIDLCGIKGGYNSGIFENTKSILIRVPVEVPNLIRRASQALGLRSEASSIFERRVNSGGTIDALQRAVDLVLELAGGEIASSLIDIKKEDFIPWRLELNNERLNKILGIEIKETEVISLLERVSLSPKASRGIIQTTIPTYRNDLKIEEDLIEEVARFYGYNNFPKTMPAGAIPTGAIPYFKDFRLEEKIKSVLTGAGFSEVYSYSLVSEKNLSELEIDSEKVLRVDNPVSLEFEYLRPTLKIGLLAAVKQNKSYFDKIELFELGKVYLGKNVDNAKEAYFLSGISNVKSYYEVKGVLERLLAELGSNYDLSKSIELTEEGIIFELNLSDILKNIGMKKKFVPVPKYPPVIEDLSIEIEPKIKYGEIVNVIAVQSKLFNKVELLDEYGNKKTFRITYLSRDRNLTSEDIEPIREKITAALKKSFKAEPA
ncbi:MAG: phenylalanine--tRNA ligase subunit beta [Candidatus Levybacteria bacterium]|nr:phenylalanine--tRNA ligase subunit beta [Candidatus Levybacteria bacterium]